MPWVYCQRCDREFRSAASMQQHMDHSIMHTEYVEVCSVCDRGFFHDAENALLEHKLEMGHFMCPTPGCRRFFSTPNNLREHMQKHMPRTTQCQHCREDFRHVKDVILHLEGGFCSKGIMSRQRILSIARTMDRRGILTLPYYDDSDSEDSIYDSYDLVYGYEDLYECFKCGREFQSQKSVITHLNSGAHAERAYKCNGLCGKSFSGLGSVAQHVWSTDCWPHGRRVVNNLLHGIWSGKRFTL